MRDPENRRARLKEWFLNRSVPAAEKSYISQLMTGSAPFGEKAAIRLEKELGMPDGWLDQPVGTPEPDQTTAEIIYLLNTVDDEGKTRAKFALKDAVEAYAALQQKDRAKAALAALPKDTLIKLTSLANDPNFALAFEALVDSFSETTSEAKSS